MNPLRRFLKKFTGLPNKKHYLEFVTAFLSIPVLLTVVYMNYLSIQEKRTIEDLNPTPAPTQSVITIIRERDSDSRQPLPTQATVTGTSGSECTPGIGTVSIINPADSVTISSNPLEIDIKYDKGDYCAVVWSYRINGSSWSEYTDSNVVIYNLPSGQKKIELRIKSIVSGETQTIERNFTYTNTQEVPTPTATPTSTPSPTPTTGTVQGATIE